MVDLTQAIARRLARLCIDKTIAQSFMSLAPDTWQSFLLPRTSSFVMPRFARHPLLQSLHLLQNGREP